MFGAQSNNFSDQSLSAISAGRFRMSRVGRESRNNGKTRYLLRYSLIGIYKCHGYAVTTKTFES